MRFLATTLCFLLTFVFLASCATSKTKLCVDKRNQGFTMLKKKYSQSKPRPESPSLKEVKTFKISDTDKEGFLYDWEKYNEKGLVSEIISYDYYGGGEEDGKITKSYDQEGCLLKFHSTNSGNTDEYSWDNNGKSTGKKWYRGEYGASEIPIYDKHGNISEIKYFNKDGTLNYSGVWERTYDKKGNVVTEKKWEKYTDRSADLLTYHYQQSYNSQGWLLKQERLNDSGEINRIEEYVYDESGNKIEERVFRNAEAKHPEEKTISTYNEFGEIITSENYSCAVLTGECTAWSKNTWEYDKYGHVLVSLTVQDNGDNFGERRVYTYRNGK